MSTQQQTGASGLFPCCPLDDEQPCPQAAEGGHDLPCNGPHCTPDEAADLQRRIDRTLDYLSEVARVAQNETTARVALACIKSLETPTANGRGGAVTGDGRCLSD
jgi:hypothetical protein